MYVFLRVLSTRRDRWVKKFIYCIDKYISLIFAWFSIQTGLLWWSRQYIHYSFFPLWNKTCSCEWNWLTGFGFIQRGFSLLLNSTLSSSFQFFCMPNGFMRYDHYAKWHSIHAEKSIVGKFNKHRALLQKKSRVIFSTTGLLWCLKLITTIYQLNVTLLNLTSVIRHILLTHG